MKSPTLPLFCVLVLLGTGCLDRQEQRLDERQELTEEVMVEHGSDARRMRAALVKGDFEAAMAALEQVASRMPLKVLAPQAHNAQSEFLKAMSAAKASPDLPTLAQRYGVMLQSCGDCHRASGIHIEVAVPTPAAPDAGTAARMAVHGAASEAMVMALVAADEASFAQAAQVLREASLVPEGVDTTGTLPAGAVETGVRLGDLAAQAARAEADRGERVGELLSTCASCHAMAGRGGG